MNLPLPLPVERAIKKLGADLSLARRRRNMTQAMLAERLGTSVMTVRRMALFSDERRSGALTAAEVEEVAPAFEHAEMDRVKALLSVNFK